MKLTYRDIYLVRILVTAHAAVWIEMGSYACKRMGGKVSPRKGRVD